MFWWWYNQHVKNHTRRLTDLHLQLWQIPTTLTLEILEIIDSRTRLIYIQTERETLGRNRVHTLATMCFHTLRKDKGIQNSELVTFKRKVNFRLLLRRVLQRAVAAWITLPKNTSNVTFFVVNWWRLTSRRKMLDYILVFKYLNNLVPRCLSTL